MDILQMSLSASVLIVFTVVIRFLFKNKIPKNILSIFWGIVCCKLMLPVSIYSYFENIFNKMPDISYKIGLPEIYSGIYITKSATSTAEYLNLKIIWIVGVICFALYFTYAYIRLMSIFKMAMPADNISFLNNWRNKNSIRRNVSIQISDRIISPLTYGVFHPVILLPKKMDWSNIENISFVLEHEMAHIKRLDCASKLFLTMILVCHWFNPFVWIMYFMANRDIELACDEKVIRSVGIKQRALYAGTLLEWEEQKLEFNALVSNFKQKFLEERIVSIMKIKKISMTGIVLSAALVIGSAAIYAATPVLTSSNVSYELSENNNSNNNDITLGGIFEVYTPEEYEKVVEQVKMYSDEKNSDTIKKMEEDLARLKADNGKGDFVIYKGAFEVEEKLENGAEILVAFNPTIVMAPELMERDTPLTAEIYKGDIEDVSKCLEGLVSTGKITNEQKETILNKMNENLSKLS